MIGSLLAILCACSDTGPIPFLAATDAGTGEGSGGDAGGGDDAGTEPGCTVADDCAGGEVCFEGSCAPGCETNDDCGADTPICHVDADVCVQCTSNTNCGPDEHCVGFECLEICETNEDCEAGEECIDTGCVPIDPVCAAGESSCDDNVVVTCADDGLSFDRTACPGDEECIESDHGAACVSRACEPFQRGCFDSTRAWECAEDGSERIEVPCEVGEACDAGLCAPSSTDACLTSDAIALDFDVEMGRQEEVGVSFWPCDEGAVVIVTSLAVEDDIAGVFEITRRPSLPAVVTEGDHLLIEVRFSPASAGVFEAKLRLRIEGGADVSIPLTGLATEVTDDCPTARAGCRIVGGGGSMASTLDVPVGTMIECDGTGSSSSGGAIVSYGWFFEMRPDGSAARLDTTRAGWAESFIDAAGFYMVALDVIDEDGTESCSPARAEVTAVDSGGGGSLLVRLTWNTTADLDNHLLHESATGWNDSAWDCHYRNRETEWGATLDIDDVDGFGPENISLSPVEPGVSYRIGAHVSDPHEAGATVATVRVSYSGTLVEEFETTLTTTGRFWDVAAVTIEGDTPVVTVIDEVLSDIPGGS